MLHAHRPARLTVVRRQGMAGYRAWPRAHALVKAPGAVVTVSGSVLNSGGTTGFFFVQLAVGPQSVTGLVNAVAPGQTVPGMVALTLALPAGAIYPATGVMWESNSAGAALREVDRHEGTVTILEPAVQRTQVEILAEAERRAAGKTLADWNRNNIAEGGNDTIIDQTNASVISAGGAIDYVFDLGSTTGWPWATAMAWWISSGVLRYLPLPT